MWVPLRVRMKKLQYIEQQWSSRKIKPRICACLHKKLRWNNGGLQTSVIREDQITTPALEKWVWQKAHKCSGSDHSPLRLLKEVIMEIVAVVTATFQTSIDSRMVRADWKETNVTSLLKKGERGETGNNRQINLISLIRQFICTRANLQWTIKVTC